MFLDLKSEVGTLRPPRHWPWRGPADVITLPLTSLFFKFNGTWGCLCLPHLWNLQMVLAEAQLGPPQCCLFSAGGHCMVGPVLAERTGSPGEGSWEIWLPCREKGFWPSLNGLCGDGRGARRHRWPWRSWRAQASLLFSVSIVRMETSPASASREPFSELLCETFLRSTAFCSWWWIDLEDPLLIAQLQKLSESSVYLPSPFWARLRLQRREEKIKTPFLLTYKLIKPCLGATGYLFCGN